MEQPCHESWPQGYMHAQPLTAARGLLRCRIPPHKIVGGRQLVNCMRVLAAEHPQDAVIMNVLVDFVSRLQWSMQRRS